MEDRDAIFESSRRILFQHVFFQSRLKIHLAVLQQSQSVVHRVVDVDVVCCNAALDTPIFPPVSCPFCLAQILACKMRTSSVVLTPLARLVRVRGFEKDVLQLGVAQAVALWPRRVWQLGKFPF